MKTAALALGVLVVVVVVIGTSRIKSRSYCPFCHVEREEDGWRFGFSGSTVQVGQDHVIDYDSHIRQDFYPNGHVHVWVCAVGHEKIYLGMVPGPISDGSLPPAIVRRYEDDREFRTFLRKEIASGRVAQERLLKMFAIGAYARDLYEAGPDGPLIDNERRALLAAYEESRPQPNHAIQPSGGAHDPCTTRKGRAAPPADDRGRWADNRLSQRGEFGCSA